MYKETSKMTIHEIKLQEAFCDAVLSGNKSFEIRYNDRGYQKGDYIRFIPVTNTGLSFPHEIKKETFEITYVLDGWGLKENYVALGIKKTYDNSL